LERQFTKPWLCHRQLPHLRAKGWWSKDEVSFTSVKNIHAKVDVIQEEVLRVSAAADFEGWDPLSNDPSLTSNDNWDPRSSWDAVPLFFNNSFVEKGCKLFPKTCELLHKCKVPLVEAFFAKMAPHSDIKPHSDMCNFVLTCHLGLDVPEGHCTLSVGDTTVEWRNGHVMLFDTSIFHTAENRAPTTRYILMMRVYHPELTAVERSALQLVFDCLDEPELLDDSEALSEYEMRRRAVEAASREPWERAATRKPKRRR